MRVLLVEDEKRLAESIARGLAADGIDADLSHSGTDGYWRATEGTYDVIILDIMLPGMNGYVVCEKLRASGIPTPILMLTAKDGEYDEADGFESGADDYLRKPFSHLVLVARLRSLARRSLAWTKPTLSVGSLELDPGSMKCLLDGSPVELTRREFALLEALMQRSPDVVTKPQLIDLVWGMDFEGDPNIVEVYVGYLRKKIDQPSGTKHIQTVRGAGYQMVESR